MTATFLKFLTFLHHNVEPVFLSEIRLVPIIKLTLFYRRGSRLAAPMVYFHPLFTVGLRYVVCLAHRSCVYAFFPAVFHIDSLGVTFYGRALLP